MYALEHSKIGPNTAYTHVQEVLAKNGSFARVSMAQKGMGIRTKLRPAAAIWAKSCSVYKKVVSERTRRRLEETTDDEGLVVVLKLLKTTIRGISSHVLRQVPLVERWI